MWATCLTGQAARVAIADYVPPRSEILTGYDNIDSVKMAIIDRGPSGIEGLWQLGGNQAIVAIEPATHPALSGGGISAYQIVLVSSPRKSLRPGTVLGYISSTGVKDTYDALMYTRRTRSLLSHTQHVTLSLDSDGRWLTIRHKRSRWRLTLRHTFDFLVRAYASTTTDGSSQSSGNEGYSKIFPIVGKPLKPVYL